VSDTLILFRQAENKSAAWTFLDFIYQDDYRLRYAVTEGVLPEKTTVAANPKIASDPTTRFFTDQLSVARFEPLNVRSTDIATIVSQAVRSAYRGERSPKDALEGAAAKVNELLAYSATAW